MLVRTPQAKPLLPCSSPKPSPLRPSAVPQVVHTIALHCRLHNQVTCHAWDCPGAAALSWVCGGFMRAANRTICGPPVTGAWLEPQQYMPLLPLPQAVGEALLPLVAKLGKGKELSKALKAKVGPL